MPRPVNLVDTLHDFGPNGDIPLSLNLNTSSFSEVYSVFTGWNTLANMNYSIKNFFSPNNALLTTDLNATPNTDFIDINGNLIPPSTLYSTIGYTMVATTQINAYGVPLTPVQVSIPTARPGSNTNFKHGNTTQPGSYANTFYFFFRCQVCTNNEYRWQQHQTIRYFYNIFQKSVAIVEDITTTPVVVNNQTLSNVALNDKIKVSKAKSRGKDLSSNWLVQIRDSAGNFITAVQGVDYNITFGTLGSDIVEIEILQAKLYKIICNVAGFTSNNNTFYSQGGTGDVTVNTDSTFYLLDATTATNNQDIITLPKIVSNIVIQNQTTNIPLPTGYAGTSISINGVLDLTTASYIIKDLTSQLETLVTLTNAQWIQELNTRTNVSVEIKNKTSGAILLTKDGIGPHENLTLPEGNYLIQYKTVLK